MGRGRGRFLKSMEEDVTLVRSSGTYNRDIVYEKNEDGTIDRNRRANFKAICLVATPSDNPNLDPSIFKDTYAVHLNPSRDDIYKDDLIIRWKLIKYSGKDSDEDSDRCPSDKELIDARGPGVLTVVHEQANRGKQTILCRALEERLA